MDDELSQKSSNWLTEIILAVASKLPQENQILTTIKSPQGSYQILNEIGKTENYILYRCLLPSPKEKTSQIALLKISVDQDDRGLDKEALILEKLRQAAIEIDNRRDPSQPAYNYNYFIPELIDSFISAEQGDRKINILGFCQEIENTTKLISLANDMFVTDNVRIDGKTSVWILGKLLKIIGFAHEQNVLNNLIIGKNILIEKDIHGVVLFDWSNATIPQMVEPEDMRREIISAAESVNQIIGGEIEEWYQLLIQRLIKGEFNDAFKAHGVFYETVFEHWPKVFYPFTTA